MNPYKPEPVHFPVRLNEFVNIPMHHPFRYHFELIFIRHDAQKRQHVWMTKNIPRHNLLAESLHGSASPGQRTILGGHYKLTLVILPMSLVVQTLNTFTAT